MCAAQLRHDRLHANPAPETNLQYTLVIESASLYCQHLVRSKPVSVILTHNGDNHAQDDLGT